jgi:uncharacterized protein YecE (DUF72 family)
LQPGLFEAADAHPAWAGVQPAIPDAALAALAGELRARHGDRLFLGTSSWHFPGWAGQVWDRAYPEARLSRDGLPAYAARPLLRTVSLDRAFYRALGVDEARRLAAQARRVAPGFRFVVKAPAALTDAVQRGAGGAPAAPNPGFLDPALAADTAAALAQGLGEMLGVWVLQLSPLPPAWRDQPAQLLARLAHCAEAIAPRLPAGALVGLELRDADLLTPALAAALRAMDWRFVLGLHDRMPPAAEQLPMLRAGWPGDLVCRWNLQRGQRYAQARDRWAPFDRLQSPDPETRAVLARVMKATLDAGHRVFVTINNKAEGSAPASVRALAQALLAA